MWIIFVKETAASIEKRHSHKSCRKMINFEKFFKLLGFLQMFVEFLFCHEFLQFSWWQFYRGRIYIFRNSSAQQWTKFPLVALKMVHIEANVFSSRSSFINVLGVWSDIAWKNSVSLNKCFWWHCRHAGMPRTHASSHRRDHRICDIPTMFHKMHFVSLGLSSLCRFSSDSLFKLGKFWLESG